MPGGDRRGPMGLGPMTGRGMGYCAGYDMPGYMNRPMGSGGMGYGRGGFGRGRGGFGGRGFARGWGYGYYSPGVPGWAPNYDQPYGPRVPVEFDPKEEKAMLEQHIESLERTLKEFEKRMKELEGSED